MARVKHKDFLDEVAVRSKVSRKTVRKVYAGIVDELWLQLDRGNSIQLNKIGTFSVKVYNPAVAKDPRTGELIKGIRYKIPKVKLARSLRNFLKWGE